MPPRFDPRLNNGNGGWRDSETGRTTSPPPRAQGLKFDPSLGARGGFRDVETGAAAPDPRRSRGHIPFSYKVGEDRYLNPVTGEIQTKGEASARNLNLNRAEIFKGIARDTGLSYQEVQQRFKGVSTIEIRGSFRRINPVTGRPEYSPPSERASEVIEQISEETGVFIGQPEGFISRY